MSFSNLGKPKTIDELKDYCQKNGYTENKTRFFVGYDYGGAKAFGIYLDENTGEYVVYKNKDDGSRAVRYRGTDEEFAVSELYERLQSEIANQKLKYAADMAEKERKKEDDELSAIKNFNIRNYPVRESFSDCVASQSYGYNRNGSKRSVYICLFLWIIYFVCTLISMHNKLSDDRYEDFGGYSSYYRDYDRDFGGNDSGWSSDSWNSDYTDWSSDW